MLLKAGKGKFLEDLKDKPVDEVLPVLDRHGRSLEAAARPAFIALIAPLRNIAEQYSNGTAGRTIAVLLTLVVIAITFEILNHKLVHWSHTVKTGLEFSASDHINREEHGGRRALRV